MTYTECLLAFEKHILPIVNEKYSLQEYTIKPIVSHEGGRNLVFTCEKQIAESKILRISYQNDRSENDYLAELEYVRYLSINGASVSNVINSTDGNLLEQVYIDNYPLYISVFEKAKGMQLCENNYKYREGVPITEYFYNCGKTLGKIHQLSKTYKPVHKRITFENRFNNEYINELLPESLSAVKIKIAEILSELSKIDKSNENYGMVHFDYSDGNYHINFENGDITVYDFDNCCFAWYIYDLAELFKHGEGWIFSENDEFKRKSFMDNYFSEIVKGYRSETDISDLMLDKLLLFVQANRIENLVDAFEVERYTNENYLDEEDLQKLCKKILEDILY